MDLFQLSNASQLLASLANDFCGWVGSLAREFAHTIEYQGVGEHCGNGAPANTSS
jgi:hypothetical protein